MNEKVKSAYAEAGVDFEKEHDVVAVFTKLFEQTRGNIDDLKDLGFELPKEIGYFADGITFDTDLFASRNEEIKLLKSMDGAGTKPLAHQLYKMIGGNKPEALASVGVDTVAMVVNDMLCAGARTLLLTDYVAWTSPDVEIAKDLAAGLLVGANQAQCVVIGGENASLGEMIKGVPPPGMEAYINGAGISFRNVQDSVVPGHNLLRNLEKYFTVTPGNGYDICADAFGIILDSFVAKTLAGEGDEDFSQMKKGDVIIGVRSSGIHCNGISLARKKLVNYSPMGWQGEFKPEQEVDEFGGKTALEEILTPTLIYSPLLGVVTDDNHVMGDSYCVKAVVNITGEGVRNLHRALGDKFGADLDFSRVKEPQQIFPMLQKLGEVSTGEMYEDFNMGYGLYVVADKNHAGEAIELIQGKGFEADPLGEVTGKAGQIRIKAHDGKEEMYEK